MFGITLCFLSSYVLFINAFSSSRTGTRQSLLQLQRRQMQSNENNEKCIKPCQELDDDNDILLDRREALFASIGTIWATTNGIISTELIFPTQTANAAYGADAKIELPNPYQSLADRATKQCLVESLGNRECLVYADEANFLYKGADSKILLERIEKANIALSTIPTLVESKKWSQITGVLTGPVGELIRNMGQLAELSDNVDTAKDIVKIIKKDLYAMNDGIARKDSNLVLKYHTETTNDLIKFIKAL